MSFFKKLWLFFAIFSNCLYACNDVCKIVNKLSPQYDKLSPNILNLCNDLHNQNYQFDIINNNNLGIYKNNDKLIEIPIDCKQPEINDCIQWSGIQFATNKSKQDMIVDLYFNMLGFKDRQYNNIFVSTNRNIFKKNNKYENIKLNDVKHTYPLFKLEGTNYFTNIVRESLKNVIYTDPGKLLMYRLFLASTEQQNNPDIEFIKIQLDSKTDFYNSLMEYKFPITINRSYNGAIHSIKNSRIGISLDPVDLFSVISNEKSNNIGALARPIETSLYHELVHCFKQLFFIQLVKSNTLNQFDYKLSKHNIIEYPMNNNLISKFEYTLNNNSSVNQTFNSEYNTIEEPIDTQIINPFDYKLRISASVQQVFNVFTEYSMISEPMNKKTIYNIFCSILLYKDGLDSIASSEEFTTMIGIYPGSKYYYPGAELSENLFRYYTNMPIRDTHFSTSEAYNPYSQSVSFINNLKNKIASLNLQYSNINFHLPQKNNVQNMKHSDIINFYNNQINNINNLKSDNEDNIQANITGHDGCNYKLLDSSLLYGIYGMLDKIKFCPKKMFSLYDVNAKIDEVY